MNLVVRLDGNLPSTHLLNDSFSFLSVLPSRRVINGSLRKHRSPHVQKTETTSPSSDSSLSEIRPYSPDWSRTSGLSNTSLSFSRTWDWNVCTSLSFPPETSFFLSTFKVGLYVSRKDSIFNELKYSNFL